MAKRTLSCKLKIGLRVYMSILCVIAVLSVFVTYSAHSYKRSFDKDRMIFRLINDAVIGRIDFDLLIPYMRDLGYDYTAYEQILQAYKNNAATREEILVEIRKFTDFIRKAEDERFKRSYLIISSVLLFILTGLLVGLVFSYRNYNLAIMYIQRSADRLNKIADEIFVSKIVVAEGTTCLEEEIVERAVKKINLFQDILETLKNIPMTVIVEDFIQKTGPHLCKYFNSQRFSVAFIDYNEKAIIAETAYFTDKNIRAKLGPGFTKKFSETSLGEMVKDNISSRIIDNFEESYALSSSESIGLLLEEGFKSNLTVLASVNNVPFGFFFLTSKDFNNYREDDAKLFVSVSRFLSYRLFYSFNIQKTLSEFGNSLSNMVEFRDTETGNHIKRVAHYAKIMATKMNLPPKLIRLLYDFAPLHDIGKVGISDTILLKPGKLDPDEWQKMKEHVNIGVQIIDSFAQHTKGIIDEETINTMRNIVKDHHEWWNGEGYPNGKRGEEISIEGRIVAVADVFDALTTKRPYKEPIAFGKAVNIILENSGTHFDPNVVKIFVESLEQIRVVYEQLKD